MPYIRKTKPIDTIALYNAFNDDELIAVFASIKELADWLRRPVESVKATISQIQHGRNKSIYINEEKHQKAKIYIYH